MEDLNEFINDILSVYEDPKGSYLIPKKKILMALRSSGLNLTNEELEKIALKMIQENTSTSSFDNAIKFDNYKKVFMEYIVKTNNIKKLDNDEFDSFQLLMQAYKTIDVDNKGYIELTKFVNLLKSNGEYMADEEINQMINLECITNGNFYYEDYCRKIDTIQFNSILNN